ncbi:MAG: SRPBCC domain-containing protein [Bacteroidia bacterium]
MQKLQYTITITAHAARIFDLMLGLSNKSTYEQWTALFSPTSSFEGSWEAGSKMQFVGVDEQGEKGGMLSRIAENCPNEFVSIQHYGLVQGGKEVTEGPEVEKWANGFENYTFASVGINTTVTVDLDATDEFADYMNETYPLALQKLKEMWQAQ